MSEMADTLRYAGRRSCYRRCKQIVEPVFGQIKRARGFRQFLFAGPSARPCRMGHDLHRPHLLKAHREQAVRVGSRMIIPQQRPAQSSHHPLSLLGETC